MKILTLVLLCGSWRIHPGFYGGPGWTNGQNPSITEALLHSWVAFEFVRKPKLGPSCSPLGFIGLFRRSQEDSEFRPEPVGVLASSETRSERVDGT